MLREIVVKEEMPGDFQTTFRLRVDGNVIAENVTELETQFLVSEMLERIPSLRVVASDDPEQPLERWRRLAGGRPLEGVQRTSEAMGAVFMPSLWRARVSPQAERRGASR
jgi:hypothetical protein